MSYRVHLLQSPDTSMLDELRGLLDDAIMLTVGDTVPSDTQALIAGRPTLDQLRASPQLRLLLIPFAGLPAITRERMADFPQVAVHSIHHNSAVTAEMAITLMMSAARLIVPADVAFRRGDWAWRYDGHGSHVVLAGKTALILGYGEIGRRVGRACEALDMRVLAVRRSPDTAPNVYTPDALPQLWPQAHVVIVTLPDTPDTQAIVDADALAALPPKSIVVNVGRAAAIDEAALFSALQSGHLHAAGLDVWYQYPTDAADYGQFWPSAQPFWALDNVVMSPHRAGGLHNEEVERARMIHLARSLNAAAHGETVPHRVDIGRGY